MKKMLSCTVGLVSMALVAGLLAQEKSAGFVDFGKIPGSASKKEFVEISVGRTLFAISAKLFEKNDPDAAKLLRGLELVQVNVVGLADDNRAEMQEHVRKLRADLIGKGWERIVAAKDGKDDVAIYLKTRGEEAVEGLAITVLDGDKEAVLINIVGNIKPEQVAMIGEKMNLDPLKKFAGAKKK
jgi:uncharacterized protein DUF4252